MKHRIKTVARRVIPDSWIARFRLHQQSRHARVNLDVFTDQSGLAKAWLRVTPDTYRVRRSLPNGSAREDLAILQHPAIKVPDTERDRIGRVLVDPEIGAAVVAQVGHPKIKGMYRTEPALGPVLIAAPLEHLAEVGVSPDSPPPLSDVYWRLRAAGHRIGVLTVPEGHAAVVPESEIARDAVVILAMVPMHDVGGGARSSQLALEMIRQGFHVVLVNLFEADESVDLGLRFVHPNLEQIRLDDFDALQLAARCNRPGMVLAEAPHHQMNRVAFAMQDEGWEVVYDVIDDWSDNALGGGWFSVVDEKALVQRADRVIASAPDLVERIRIMRKPASLVPNAVNPDIFSVDRARRPDDLPQAEVILGYHGSLYGDWFDWDALLEVAEAFPKAAVVVIGDDKVKPIELPKNVVFLGLKPQIDLPGYVQHFDVGLIPFKVSPTTHAVSPLKVFEYLASGVPVAAPPLRPLAGLDGVYADYDLVPMVEKALAGPRPDRQAHLDAHSWSQRVGEIWPVDSRSAATQPTSGATTVFRPVVHWPADQRHLP